MREWIQLPYSCFNEESKDQTLESMDSCIRLKQGFTILMDQYLGRDFVFCLVSIVGHRPC
jgi:hypothetical protein